MTDEIILKIKPITLASENGRTTPMLPSLLRSTELEWVTAVVSVMPYELNVMQPNLSCNVCTTCLLTAPDPNRSIIRELKSNCFSTGFLAIATAMAGTKTVTEIYIK